MESGWEEVEARELRRRHADWEFIQRLPPRLRAALNLLHRDRGPPAGAVDQRA